MTSQVNPLLNWLKTFQTEWLPENIPNNTNLLESIQTKLQEFEQLIIENNNNDDDDEEYHRARLLNELSSSNSDDEQNALASTSTYETPIDSNNHMPIDDDDNEELHARGILLEQSDDSEQEQDMSTLRPTIRLKRISEIDAERYKPLAYRTEKENEMIDDTFPSSSSSLSGTSEDEDYYLKYRTRKITSKNTTNSPKKSSTPIKKSFKKTAEVVISYNQPLESNQSTNSDEDRHPIDDEQIQNEASKKPNNSKNNSSIFESLNVTSDTPMDTAPDDPVETVSNEENNESSNEISSEEQLPSEVISYAHLLEKNKDASSSSSESEVIKRKRLLASPSNSEEILRKKKSKKMTPKKRAAPFVLSSSSDENNSTLTSSRLQVLDLSSSDDDFEQPKKSSKAKRSVKPMMTTSDESDKSQSKEDENEEDCSPTKGRKNIRKILDDNRLDDETKKAIEAERERRRRLAENQEKYNNSLLEQSSQLSTSSNTQSTQSEQRLILELDKNTNEPLIEVETKLVKKLKPHQCEGVKFLWNNVFESIETIRTKKNSGNGCILAHCMGLGKTLQVITFVHTIFKYSDLTKIKTCLVLCPLNTVLNWSNEFDHWLNGIEPSIDRHQLTTVRPNLRINLLNYWFEHGGVAIMSYDLYKKLANGTGIQNKKNKDDAFKCLLDPGPDLIVADEGHILKNSQTALAKCLSKIKTRRRIVLTGTPLQNNLIEYYCMVSFIKPNLLGSQSEYINRFVNPIQNGQHRDSNESDVRLMKRRACVLHELLSGFIDRKDYSLLKEYLPPKYEYIINVRLSDLQSRLYYIYLEKLVDKQQRLSKTKNDFKSAKLFADYQYLQKIWTHPFLLYAYYINHWKKCQNKDDLDLIDENDSGLFLNDDELAKKKTNEPIPASNYAGFLIDNIKDEILELVTSESSTTTTTTTESDSTSKTTDDDDDDIEIIKTYETRSRVTTNEPIHEETTTNNEPWLNDMRRQFWYPFLDMLPEESQFDIEISGKFLLLHAILEKCTEIGDKVIVFSRSIYTLNHIEAFLHSIHQWTRDKDYFRMDGQTDVTSRKRYAKWFNDLSNTRARLFLISTLAGGIGINLVGGNRVIIFDASWNPSHDTQAIFRSYRFGQKKPVYIYRFLAHGTMEEKIYQRQVVKQSLSQRVIDDHQLDRHFTQNDIKELYKFQLEQLPDAQTTLTPLNFGYPIPKDHLLLDILYEHNRWIHSYHSHDSLLENKIDESLTAEERQRALQEYEELKRKPDHQLMMMQRIQEQQRLNQNIALQHQRAAMAHLQQVLQSGNVQQSELPQIIRNMEELVFMPRTNNPINRPTTVQQPQQRPTNSVRNDVIVVESDDDPTHRNT